jgi:hypothetical protein
MLQIQPQVEEDYASVRAFHRTTYFHYIFGKGLPCLAIEASPSANINPNKKLQPADGTPFFSIVLSIVSRLAVVPDALIFAMTTGGPKQEFDALLLNATTTQLNCFSSKGV